MKSFKFYNCTASMKVTKLILKTPTKILQFNFVSLTFVLKNKSYAHGSITFYYVNYINEK